MIRIAPAMLARAERRAALRALRRTLAVSFPLFTAFVAGPITAAEESPLRVTELSACEEIVDRSCRGASATFGPEVDSVSVLSRVEGATGEAYVTHVWTFEKREIRRTRLAVKASPYRTWSAKRVAGLPGKWKVEVFDPVGRSLGAVEFVVEPPPRQP